MDATTRWETEAMRSSRPKRSTPPRPSGKRSSSARWVTLREAEQETSIPTNTLRKWARKGDIPTFLESDGDLALRMVDLDAVTARAAELGRAIGPLDGPNNEAEPPAAESNDQTPSVEPPGPEGTMIVPIDAWNKMLNQLGNLHDAGQQLAEARERAAKAETEARFLRERLAELRSSTAPAEHSEFIPPSPKADPTPAVPPVHDERSTRRTTTPRWRVIVDRALRKTSARGD